MQASPWWSQLPDWVGDLGQLSIAGFMILAFGWALATRRIYLRGQTEELVQARKDVAALWEKVAEERQRSLMELTEAIEPVVAGNAAILRAVDQLQTEQQRQRDRDPRRAGR